MHKRKPQSTESGAANTFACCMLDHGSAIRQSRVRPHLCQYRSVWVPFKCVSVTHLNSHPYARTHTHTHTHTHTLDGAEIKDSLDRMGIHELSSYRSHVLPLLCKVWCYCLLRLCVLARYVPSHLSFLICPRKSTPEQALSTSPTLRFDASSSFRRFLFGGG
jgi:hypothetical protein